MICPQCKGELVVLYMNIDVLYVCIECGQIYRYTWATTLSTYDYLPEWE